MVWLKFSIGLVLWASCFDLCGYLKNVDGDGQLTLRLLTEWRYFLVVSSSYFVSSCYFRGLLPEEIFQVPCPMKLPMSHPAIAQRAGIAQQVKHHP